MKTKAQMPINLQEKRAQELAQLKKRLRDEGVPEDRIDARIAQMSFERMPIDQKVVYLERVVAHSVRGLAQDINVLHHNDKALGVSFRVVENILDIIFDMMELSAEDKQKVINRAVENAERDARREDEEKTKEQEESLDSNEAESAEKAFSDKEDPLPDGEPQTYPAGAAVFGG